MVKAEYIWVDGQKPRAKLRSKTKILLKRPTSLAEIPDWGFDGSSTEQAETKNSDCALKPVAFIPDPIRGEPHILVMCEVFNADGSVHKSNTRARLREAAEKYKAHDPWFGIEQEYTLYDADGVRPYRWPAGAGFPAPQGRYYCGVGTDEVYGAPLIEAHTTACMNAGLAIAGTNAEVMPAQWEFQIGALGAPAVADQLWFARWILYRLGDQFGISVKLDPKPIAGDWNGAGAHTNFSTKAMREPGGMAVVESACKKLSERHKQHISVYGAENDKRLTGRHETCDINTFRYGVSDRGASIRIPMATAKQGYGYIEDRRPAASMDPYKVCTALIETVCGDGFIAPQEWVEIVPK